MDMNPISAPRQLLFRSLAWFRSEEPAANEEVLAKNGLDAALRRVRDLSRFGLITQASGASPKEIELASAGCEHSLVSIVYRSIRKAVSLTDDELAACFSLLNAYRRAYPESSRAGP